MTEYKMIKSSEIKEDAIMIDVRTTMEHQSQHLLRPHNNIPLDQLNPKEFIESNNLNEDDNIYILCRSGMRSKTAADKFIKDGYNNIYIIEGGIIACEQEGESVFTAHNDNTDLKLDMEFLRRMPLERQVRLFAGGLVILGILLGGFVHSVFYLLTLFIGAGLVYSAVTNKCGMAIMLTKAPWNKSTGSNASRSCATEKMAKVKSCNVKEPESDTCGGKESSSDEDSSIDKKSA